MSDLQDFFVGLERCYAKERQDFVWDWDGVEKVANSRNLPPGCDMLTDYICFIAYNLAKNIIHGELPLALHSRMVFYRSEWARKYIEFLEA